MWFNKTNMEITKNNRQNYCNKSYNYCNTMLQVNKIGVFRRFYEEKKPNIFYNLLGLVV